MTKPAEFREFTAILGELDDGRVVEELTHQMREVVRAARGAKKKGSLTLKIDITPDGDRQFIIDASVTPKLPTPTPGMTMYFATDAGDLRKDDPRQVPLRHVDAKPPTPLRNVGAAPTTPEGV